MSTIQRGESERALGGVRSTTVSYVIQEEGTSNTLFAHCDFVDPRYSNRRVIWASGAVNGNVEARAAVRRPGKLCP